MLALNLGLAAYFGGDFRELGKITPGALNVCSPSGNPGDSSQSATRWISSEFKPIVDSPDREISLDAGSVMNVVEFPSRCQIARIQALPFESSGNCALKPTRRAPWPTSSQAQVLAPVS